MSRLSQREIGLLVAAGALLLVGVGADAVFTRGLHDPVAMRAAAARLQRIPANIGGWVSVPQEVDDREQRLAEIFASVRREYRHVDSGRTIVLTILCGAAGPMSVHPPTACFEGIGYVLVSGPTLVSINDDSGSGVSLKKASFRFEDSALSEVVRVFWGWSTDGDWGVPENPRITFRGQPVLFKLYVADRAFESASDLSQCEVFLAEALPVIRKVLQPDP